MVVRKIYESQRDLLIGQLYKRSNTSVASRSYTYDTLERPMTRSTSKDGATVNDSFGYNSRSELNTATVNNAAYAYDYDNIGNRETAQETAESATFYESNCLNQYTAIGDFEPTYDDAGNQTKVKTSTGIWSVVYNAENRPTSFTNADSGTVVECTYDYMGRRATKKVTVNGGVTLHQRFLYRGYLQIACCDLTRSNHPCLWLITWDPSQPVATRPLAIQKDATWYTYGWDLTKNICEIYGQHGYIRTSYTYTPYGEVTATGDVTQPIQWSSEYNDAELALVYYNYRHYNPVDGRWLTKDPVKSNIPLNYYWGIINAPIHNMDYLGLEIAARICTKDATKTTRCGITGQKMCEYHCECPSNYIWRDLGTGSERITRPCSDPDTVKSGTCTRRNRRVAVPKRRSVPQIEPVYSNPTSESLYHEYRMGTQDAMNLGVGVAAVAALVVVIVVINVFTPFKWLPA